MRYVRAVLVALALVFSLVLTGARAQEVSVTFENACQTTSTGGTYRWAAKTHATLPGDPGQVQPTTVGAIIGWTPLPGNWRDRAHVSSPRQPGQEQQFFELVAAVQRVGLDPDGRRPPGGRRRG